MLKLFRAYSLQLFAEGGDGGDGGNGDSVAEATNIDSGEDIPASIPEKAREMYRKAQKRMPKAPVQTVPEDTTSEETADESAKPTHISYRDLINSDEYKDEHKAYMDKTIGDRLKKYKGIEESNGKMKEILDIVANKYGVDVNAEDFIDQLRARTEEDDSYYEQYAMDHDLTPAEARKIVTLERKVKQAEEEKARQEKEAENSQRWINFQRNAELTKQQFPDFDLQTEMQNEKFMRLCASNNDDTTSAYMACHWQELFNKTAAQASQRAQIQTANAIASGKNRPIESGLSSSASAVVKQDFRNMNLAQIRQYAEEQRRLKR